MAIDIGIDIAVDSNGNSYIPGRTQGILSSPDSAGREDFDFFATYFRLPDIAQHSVTHLMDWDFKKKLISAFDNHSIDQEMIDDAVLRVSDILESVYRHMENTIRDYITQEESRNTTFLIMSDHGFSFYPGGYNHYGLPDEYPAPALSAQPPSGV